MAYTELGVQDGHIILHGAFTQMKGFGNFGIGCPGAKLPQQFKLPCGQGKDYYLYDCGLSMMSLVYQAESLGIRSRQTIGWDEQQVKDWLMIPGRCRVVVITAIGYANETGMGAKMSDWKRTLTGQHKRYDSEHTVFWQSWGEWRTQR
jgi:nitroreductase